MFNELGAVLIFFGLLFTFSCWFSKSYEAFLFQIMLGPVFIGLGLQLIK